MSSDKDSKDKDNSAIPDEIIKPPLMVNIPAGPFLMGTSDKQIKLMIEVEDWADEWQSEDLFQAEQPQHTVNLPAYEIGYSPVTNLEYYSFIYNSGHRVPKNWVGFHFIDGEASHPVTGISKNDAVAYCKWLSKSVNSDFRLPTEAEWEKAARGTDGRIYPWGDNFDPWRCNTLESAKRNTTPCGSYSPSGDSPYGVADMSGNVWEWTSSFLLPYPFTENNEQEGTKNKCVVRGGAWYYSHKLARCSARESVLPDYISTSLGFRLVRSL